MIFGFEWFVADASKRFGLKTGNEAAYHDAEKG